MRYFLVLFVLAQTSRETVKLKPLPKHTVKCNSEGCESMKKWYQMQYAHKLEHICFVYCTGYVSKPFHTLCLNAGFDIEYISLIQSCEI